MRPIALSDEIAVGEVPLPAEIEILSKAGFRSLINAQPDGEVARFADAATTRRAAEAVGLAYAHVPIESRMASEALIQSFAEALSTLPRPIYAFCYSGGRAAAAWALAMATQTPPVQLAQALENAGFDASALRPALIRRSVGLPAYEVVQVAPTLPVASIAVSPVAVDAIAPPAVEAQVPAPLLAPEPAPLIIVLPRAASDGGFAVPG